MPASRVPRPPLGPSGEQLAADHLTGRGYTIVARNWRLSSGELRGELDLVCLDGDTLVVVEVKARASDRFGGPLVAVTPAKQAKIRALTAAFLRQAGMAVRRVRFDVVAVWLRPGTPPALAHVPDAF